MHERGSLVHTGKSAETVRRIKETTRELGTRTGELATDAVVIANGGDFLKLRARWPERRRLSRSGIVRLSRDRHAVAALRPVSPCPTGKSSLRPLTAHCFNAIEVDTAVRN
jgi:hypothetical protein